jgi:hypothetical protein
MWTYQLEGKSKYCLVRAPTPSVIIMFCAERAADRAVVRQGASNQRASIMKVVPLAIATALAATLGSVPASFAQPYGQNNQGNNQSEYQSDTMGAGNQAQNDDDWRRGRAEDRDQDANRDRDRGGAARWHHRWGPRMGSMGQMDHRGRGPMLQGAHFHFVRGNARVDIQCPPQNDMQSCVQAAGQLLDKIGILAEPGAGTNSSGTGSSGTPATPPSNPSPPGRM